MSSHRVVIATAIAVALCGSAVGAQQGATFKSQANPVASPVSPQVGQLQVSANDRMSMDLARANQQIADLRQQMTAMQQELRQFRATYNHHTHQLLGSAAPIEDIVRRPEGYRNMRTWIGNGLPLTGAPKSSQ